LIVLKAVMSSVYKVVTTNRRSQVLAENPATRKETGRREGEQIPGSEHRLIFSPFLIA